MSKFFSLQQLRKLGVKLLSNVDGVQVSKKAVLYKPQNITLKNHVRIDDGVVLSADGRIEIGNYVHIARNCLLYSGTSIVLSDFTGISSGCKLYGSSDNYNGTALTGPTVPEIYRDVVKGDIILAEFSIIGSSSVVLPNTKLNEGTAVGALSLIRGELQPWCIYGGNPLKFLKHRQRDCKQFGRMVMGENDIEVISK